MNLYPVGMAEPKKNRIVIETERQKVLSFRLSQKEYDQIEARAQALGLRITQYVRSLALRDSEPPKN